MALMPAASQPEPQTRKQPQVQVTWCVWLMCASKHSTCRTPLCLLFLHYLLPCVIFLRNNSLFRFVFFFFHPPTSPHVLCYSWERGNSQSVSWHTGQDLRLARTRKSLKNNCLVMFVKHYPPLAHTVTRSLIKWGSQKVAHTHWREFIPVRSQSTRCCFLLCFVLFPFPKVKSGTIVKITHCVI